MNNAERRNIHARTTCSEARMDRHVPSLDEDDGIGMSGITATAAVTMDVAPARVPRRKRPRARRNRVPVGPKAISQYLESIENYSALVCVEDPRVGNS